MANARLAIGLLETLPRPQRAAVVLRFYDDLPFAQIAEILDCTESTARSHVHRALATLRQQLAERIIMSESREQDAFREGLELLQTPGTLNPAVARQRALRGLAMRGGVAALASATLIGGTIVGIQRLTDNAEQTVVPAATATATTAVPASPTAAPSPTPTDGPPAKGRRAEYYRDIRIDVPASWGHRYEPGWDWCADRPSDYPSKPYIAHGGQPITRAIACREDYPPPKTWVEHIVLLPYTVTDPQPPERIGDWWVIETRVSDALIKIVSKDRKRASAILATARPVDGVCAATSPAMRDMAARPPAFKVEKVQKVDSITVCQYDIGPGVHDPDSPVKDNPYAIPGGLRARIEVKRAAANELLAAIKSAPIIELDRCKRHPVSQTPYPEQALVLHLRTGDKSRELYLIGDSCDPTRGGFTDGTDTRQVTHSACGPIFKLPIDVYLGSSDALYPCYPR